MVAPVQSTSWQPGCSVKVRTQRTAPVHGSNAEAWSLPVTITIGRLEIEEAVTKRPSGSYAVVAPVRRPWNDSPATGSTWPCQMLTPVDASRATTTPSDHLVITTEIAPPTLDFSMVVIPTTSAGQRRKDQC